MGKAKTTGPQPTDETKTLHLVTTSRKEDPHYSIDDIPPPIWNKFVEQAKLMMPERGDTAWSSAIVEFIGRVAGNKTTYLMTDIPADLRDGLEGAAQEAKLTTDALFKEMWDAAGRGRIHIINFQNSNTGDPSKRHVLMFVNLMDEAVQGWNRFAGETNIAFAELMGRLMEASANGALQYRQWDTEGKLEKEVKAGDTKGAVRRDQSERPIRTGVSGGALSGENKGVGYARPAPKQSGGPGDSGRTGSGDRPRRAKPE